MVRAPCCDDPGLKKGPWTPEEDHKLSMYVQENGLGSWKALPKQAGLSRCGKSCRLRWTNYLRPGIKHGNFSLQEEHTIIQLHAVLGNRWSTIATYLPGRTDNDIKNFWNTHLKKRLWKMGIDPVTHRPSSLHMMAGCYNPNPANNSLIKSALLDCINDLSNYLSTRVPPLARQWETASLEADARCLARDNVKSAGFSQEDYSRFSHLSQLLIHLSMIKMLGDYQGAAPYIDSIIRHGEQLGVHNQQASNPDISPCSKLPFNLNSTEGGSNLCDVAYAYKNMMPCSSDQQLLQNLPFLENMNHLCSGSASDYIIAGNGNSSSSFSQHCEFGQASIPGNLNSTAFSANASLANQQTTPWLHDQRGNADTNQFLPNGTPQLAGLKNNYIFDINTRGRPPALLLDYEPMMTAHADNDVASSSSSTVATTSSTTTRSSADNTLDYWTNLLNLLGSNSNHHT